MKIKRLISLVLVLFMVCSIITACDKKTDGPAENDQTTTEEAKNDKTTTKADKDENPFKEHVEISLALWDLEAAMSTDDSDPIFEKLMKDFNMSIKPVGVTWDDFNDKINVWTAGGMLPDVFITDQEASGTFVNWVKGGLLKAIPSDLSKYPNLEKVMALPDVAGSAIDGKQYFIPRLMYDMSEPYIDNRAIIIRADWMKKVGWDKDPADADEFLQLMKDLTEGDPDENGNNDTPGLSAVRQDYLVKYPLLFFNPALPTPATGGFHWIKEGGKWIPALMSSKMSDYIVYMRRLVTEGVLDMDFATFKGDEARDRFINGKVASYIRGGSIGDISATYENWVKLYPDPSFSDNVKVLTTPAAQDGKHYHYAFPNYYSSTLINAQVDDTKLDRILALMDYMITPEYTRLKKLGIEDKDYEMQGDKVVITREKDENGNFKSLEEFYPINTYLSDLGCFNINFVDPAVNPIVLEKNREWKEFLHTTQAPDVNYKAMYTKVPAMEKYTCSWEDQVVMIMLSDDDPVDMWNAYIEGEKAKGLDELIDEMNDALGN